MEEFNFDDFQGKVVVLIGELTQEGVTTKIKTLGYAYKQKRLLRTTIKNWVETKNLVSQLSSSDRLVAVFVHLTEGLLMDCTDEGYREAWTNLVDEILKANSIFFIYEENLAGNFEKYHDFWGSERIEQANKLIRGLYDLGAKITPYKRRVDLTINIQEFLDNMENGVLLRIYVPNRQYQEEQLESFIRLLENYLQDIEKCSFSVDLRKTDHGHIYEFKSKGDIRSANELTSAINRFESFMEVCQNDPNSVKRILQSQSTDNSGLAFLIDKCVRDYRRLKLDIRHEYEQKSLALKQQLESDILEGRTINSDEIFQPSSPITLLSLPTNFGAINVSVGQIYMGDVTYSKNDKQLLELFEKHAEKIDSIILKSSLNELIDSSAQKEKRQTAKQKIAGFLYKIAPIIGESLVKGLAEYLEKKLSGGA